MFVLDSSRGNRESPSKLGIYIIEGMLQACLMGMFQIAEPLEPFP